MILYVALVAVVVLVIALAAVLARKPAAPGSPAAGGSQVTAFVASREDLGVFTKMFEAIARNDRAALQAEVQFINRLVLESGSFSGLMETYVFGQLAKYVQDPGRKKKLLDFLAGAGVISLGQPAAGSAPAA
jgi:hypothetical protein